MRAPAVLVLRRVGILKDDAYEVAGGWVGVACFVVGYVAG